MAQSENVRYLRKCINNLIKDINVDIKRNFDFQVTSKTKILALLYSAWSESQFLQIAFTEHGFNYSEICSILAKKENGIADGWIEMSNIAMSKSTASLSSHIKSQQLTKIKNTITTYIKDPSSLRNKIAHGQWVNALTIKKPKTNQNYTASVNNTLSHKLAALDPVEIHKQIEIHQFLGAIIRNLVQSPEKGHVRDYAANISALDAFLVRTANWSLQTKKMELSKKPTRPNL